MVEWHGGGLEISHIAAPQEPKLIYVYEKDWLTLKAEAEHARLDERRAILRWLRTYWPNTAYEIANKIEGGAHQQYAARHVGRDDAQNA